jgi:hypothetical protein
MTEDERKLLEKTILYVEGAGINKARWPGGPWQNEPDLFFWDTRAGYPAAILRTHLGCLNGYVGVPIRDHLMSGEHYDRVEADVHGGLTYADPRLPFFSDIDGFWWFGFDAGHFGDLWPGLDAISAFPMGREGEYRTFEYMKEECEKLAAHLKECQ